MLGILYLGYALGKTNESEEDYFIASRSLPWYAIGLSVGVTMISANSFIGGPGWGYTGGMMAAMMNITVPLSILFVTYTILPVLYNARVTTIYEYVNLRLGTKSRILNVIIWLCSSLVLMGGFVYTPALVLSTITDIGFNVWVPIIVILAIVYTAIGGIKAVIWTDAMQAVVLLIGVVFATIFAFNHIPNGASGVLDIASEVGKMTSFDWAFDMNTMNVWCVFIGGFGMWAGYFGFDQGQVQRYLTSKNVTNIKKSGILSTLAMQLLFWMCVFLGVGLYVFYQTNSSTLDFSNSNLIMTDFLLNYVPNGLLGLLLAATFAAAMSSIDSVLNSLTAVFTKDIYEPYISKKSDTPLSKTISFSVIFGVVIIAFVYAGLGDNSKSILDAIGAYLSPFGSLVTGSMIICIFMPRVNDNGAFMGTIIAAALTFYTQNAFPMHWLWIYAIGSVYCVVLSYICSLFFKDVSKEKYQYTIQGVMKETMNEVDEEGTTISPLKMDKYGWMIVGIFIVQCIILMILQ
jgi:SSS family transporter